MLSKRLASFGYFDIDLWLVCLCVCACESVLRLFGLSCVEVLDRAAKTKEWLLMALPWRSALHRVRTYVVFHPNTHTLCARIREYRSALSLANVFCTLFGFVYPCNQRPIFFYLFLVSCPCPFVTSVDWSMSDRGRRSGLGFRSSWICCHFFFFFCSLFLCCD